MSFAVSFARVFDGLSERAGGGDYFFHLRRVTDVTITAVLGARRERSRRVRKSALKWRARKKLFLDVTRYQSVVTLGAARVQGLQRYFRITIKITLYGVYYFAMCIICRYTVTHVADVSADSRDFFLNLHF